MIALAGWMAWPATVLAETSCSRAWVCVEQARTDSATEFIVKNLKPFPVTISLRLADRSLPRALRRSVTRTVAGGDRLLLLRVPVGRARGYRFYYDWTVGSLGARHDDDYVYRLPYARGERFRVLQGFGSRFSHTGLEYYTVDFDMPEGTPVHAARGGIVAMIEESHSRGCWESECARYANYLVIQHDDGTTGEYYHLLKDGVLVEPGARVVQGQRIALSGNTGHTTMPHLHFGVYKAAEWGRTQSVPFRFRLDGSRLGEPRPGRAYRAE